jgi:BirA family biotin operon repressor/biotin-[acetyl-CoA-carboxylase] ligase
LLIRILQQLEKQLGRLVADDPQLAEDWQHQCTLRGLTVTVNTGTSTTTGVCQGIDEQGALVLLTEAGPVQMFGGVVETTW